MSTLSDVNMLMNIDVALTCKVLFQAMYPGSGLPEVIVVLAKYLYSVDELPLTPEVPVVPLVPFVPVVPDVPVVPEVPTVPEEPDVPEVPSPPAAPFKLTCHDE